MIVRSILITIAIFESLILIHEFGHYICARLFHIKINEFSIGMGPKLISLKSKKTEIYYSLRAFPIGGFVSMDGEDGDSEHPNAFCKKPLWQRMLTIIAGPSMNIVAGFLAMLIMVLMVGYASTTTIAEFSDTSISNADGYLQEYDKILEIDGKKVHTRTDLMYAIMFGHYETKEVTVQKNDEQVTVSNVIVLDITIERNHEEFIIENVPFRTEETEGVISCVPDFDVYYTEMSFGDVLKQSFFDAFATVKLIWKTFADMLKGYYGISAMSGPIGVTEAVSQVDTTSFYTILYLFVLITMNLGICNMIPFPALDGGRFFLLLLELIIRRPIPKRVEESINFIGLIILMGLMVLVTGKDIIHLFR